MKLKSKEKSDVKPEKAVKIRKPGPLGRMLNRSLFAKFFTACSAIMVISFLVLGTSLVFLLIGYNRNQKETLFLNNARFIANSFSEITTLHQVTEFLMNIPMTANNLDATIYICNIKGEVSVYPPNEDPYYSTKIMSASVLKKVITDKAIIKEESTLGGFFKTKYTCAGVPLVSADGTVYAVFICAKIGFMRIISGIINIFIFCVCFILAFAFVAIYIVTSRLVRPLHQMSRAARSFAKGDFSARIPVCGEDEIGQLAVGFNNMATSLASLEEMRSSFVANVSHELKTPMTSISGFIDGILDGTIPPEKENYYLKIVSDEVKRLSRLVRSFLDISRIEAGEFKINPTEFDVMEMIRRVIVGFERPISEKSLDIRGLDNDNKFMVFADFDMIYQIVYNLVDNAVKFSNEGGYIEINVAAKSKKVYVSVKNSGMGIPAADLPYVFDRFYKTDKSRSRDRKGVGLGLYIVKTELNMQGDDIVVKSVEGEFCEFVFTVKER